MVFCIRLSSASSCSTLASLVFSISSICCLMLSDCHASGSGSYSGKGFLPAPILVLIVSYIVCSFVLYISSVVGLSWSSVRRVGRSLSSSVGSSGCP